MLATDFEYDGLLLSDLGFIICNFDSNGLETVSSGSVINFNTTPILYGSKQLLTHTNYDEYITSTFSICKNPCLIDYNASQSKYITSEEESLIMRWLNRKGYYKFKLLEPNYENLFFEASFNVNRITLNGYVIGFELEMFTNRPFALQEPVTHSFTTTTDNEQVTLDDVSDEIGFSYVEATITCNKSGTLTIHNSIENRKTIIKNCTQGETIILKHPIISSSLSSHKIQNDFNFIFLRLANTFTNKKNILTFSIPCNVKLTYTPIRKVGI